MRYIGDGNGMFHDAKGFDSMNELRAGGSLI